VSLYKIRALYLSNATGIYDEELIDDVGMDLFVRCESILEFTEAVQGRVQCKRCARSRTTTIIERQTTQSGEWLRCPVCSWQVQWRVYLTVANKVKGQLAAGHAQAAFEEFVKYPRCRTARTKMLAIDRLIHEFHWELRREGQDARASRTASVNLLAGSTTEILDLLDGLAYDENAAPGLLATRSWWRAQEPIARRRDSRRDGE
jgi:hypothetical protein